MHFMGSLIDNMDEKRISDLEDISIGTFKTGKQREQD